jgi:hypothetical protein
MATNAMMASQWPTENSMSVQDQMQGMLTEYARSAAAIVMKAVIALKRGVNTEEDGIAVDDCYHHMDDMIEELGGELIEWTNWYGILTEEIEGRAEAEAAEEREREEEERRNGTGELDRGKQPVAATRTGKERDGIHAGGASV